MSDLVAITAAQPPGPVQGTTQVAGPQGVAEGQAAGQTADAAGFFAALLANLGQPATAIATDGGSEAEMQQVPAEGSKPETDAGGQDLVAAMLAAQATPVQPSVQTVPAQSGEGPGAIDAELIQAGPSWAVPQMPQMVSARPDVQAQVEPMPVEAATANDQQSPGVVRTTVPQAPGQQVQSANAGAQQVVAEAMAVPVDPATVRSRPSAEQGESSDEAVEMADVSVKVPEPAKDANPLEGLLSKAKPAAQAAPATSGAPVEKPEQAATEGARAVNAPVVNAVPVKQAASVDTQPEPAVRQEATANVQGQVVVQQTNATSTTQPAQTVAAAQPELHQQVIDQVVREVKLQRFPDRSDITIRLTPPELGSLRIRVTHDQQGMTTQIESANGQVRSLLEAHLPMLVDALANAGVRMGSVNVTPQTSFSSFMLNQNPAQQQQAQQQSGRQFAGSTHAGYAGVQQNAAAIGILEPSSAVQDGAAYSWLA